METIDKWYYREVYFWRSSASYFWYLTCLPVVTVIYVFVAQFSIFHPFLWITNTVSTFFSLYFVFGLGLILTANTILACYSSSAYSVVPEICETRLKSLASLLKPSRLIHAGIHLATGFVLAWSCSSFAGERFSKLVHQPSTQSDAPCLNEYHLFLVLYGVYTGTLYYAVFYLRQVNYLQFPVVQRDKFFQIRSELMTLLYRCARQVVHQLKYFYVFYYFLGNIPRSWITHNLNLPLSSEHHPLDSLFGMLDPWLLWEMFLCGLYINYTWSLAALLFRVYQTEHYEFPVESAFDGYKNRCLTDAVGCKTKPLIQHLGYLDLSYLSKFSPARRKYVFSLSQPGGHPHTWNKICTSCVQDIDELNIKVQDANWKAMASVPVKQQAAGDKPFPSSGDMSNGTSLYYRGLSQTGQTTPLGSVATNPREPTKGTFTLWKEKVAALIKQKPVIGYFLSELPDAKSRQLFASSQVQIWAVESLSFLAASSFKEDTFGVVQRSLPKIMTSLIHLNENVEKHFKLTVSGSRRSQKDQLTSGDAAVRFQLQSVLKSAIYRIVNTFGKHLMNVSLSDDCSKKLKPFMDYRE